VNAGVWIGGAALVAAGLALAAVLLLRGRTGAPLSEDEAAQAAQTGIAGFTARQALIADDRRSALVVGEHRRVALVVSHRKVARPREIRWSDIRATEGGLHIAAERGAGTVFVGGIDVLEIRRAGEDDWRRR
jgi:hypothetical protein